LLVSTSLAFSSQQVQSLSQPHGFVSSDSAVPVEVATVSVFSLQQLPFFSDVAMASLFSEQQLPDFSDVASVSASFSPAQHEPFAAFNIAAIGQVPSPDAQLLSDFSDETATAASLQLPLQQVPVLATASSLQQDFLATISVPSEQQLVLATAATGVFSVAFAPTVDSAERFTRKTPTATNATTVIVPNNALCIATSIA
jgi:hypothetical protein